MKKETLIQSISKYALSAAVIAAALPFPEMALAQDLTASVASVQTGIAHIPQIVAGAFYIGGAALTGAGLLQLKAHAENPGQNPLGKSLGRLAAGAGLLALPAMGTWLNTTFNVGTGGFTESTLGTLN